jgi:DNA polymerase III subunit delta
VLRIYYGPDTYSRAEALAELKAELDSDGMLSANTVQFDAADLNMAALLATCDTVPFLSTNRLVILTDFMSQAQPRRSRARSPRRASTDAGEPSRAEELAAYVSRMPASTTLLLLDGQIRPDNAILQMLGPLAEVRSFPQLQGQELLSWIAARARALGAGIEPRASALLAESLRGDLWSLASEIEKLALYTREQMITPADVREMVAAAQQSNVFAMVDATIAGRLDEALRQFRLLLNEGSPPAYIIAMIARQYRQLIILEDMAAANEPLGAMAQAAEIRSEGAARRALQQARRLGAMLLRAAYERILAADLAIKRGETEETLAVELLVADLAVTAQPGRRQQSVARQFV